MKKWARITAWIIAIGLLASCRDRLDLENATIPLAFGIDLKEDNMLRFYTSSPVFLQDSQKKSLETTTDALAPRQSRSGQGAETSGLLAGKNFQVIVMGGRVLEHAGWFKLLDVVFRDAKNTTTDRMIYYDGPLEDIMFKDEPEQPILPIFLRSMVDTKSRRSETVLTTVQEMHRHFYETGITPAMSEIGLNEKKNIYLKGTALLADDGRYRMSLNHQETTLLRILQGDADGGVSLSFSMPDKPKTGPFHTNVFSFSSSGIKTKIKPGYSGGRFKFDIDILLPAGLSEVMFPHDVRKETKELEKQLGRLAEEQFDRLIGKFQEKRVDPIGLGIYARAYEYKQYRKVQNDWPEAFAVAKINVKVSVKIKSMGPVL